MEILDFFLFWHGHCNLFCSVISFSVINYVVSMRCPRVSDDSSFFLRFTQKNGIIADSKFRDNTNIYDVQ